MLFILISDSLEISEIENPLVVDIWSKEEFLEDFELFINLNKELNIVFIIVGLEDINSLVKKKISYRTYKIEDNLYWFNSKEELDKVKNWNTELNSFIFDNFLKYYTKEIIFNKDEMLELPDVKTIIKTNKNKLLIKERKNDVIYYINLDIYQFFKKEKIDDEISFFLDTKELLVNKNVVSYNCRNFFTFENIDIRLKENALLDEKFQLDSLSEFFEDKEEIIVLFYEDCFYYQSIDYIKYNLNKRKEKYNVYETIFYIEEYLSKIELKNIDYDLYQSLNFPIKKGITKYKYNGSNTLTGRIYPVGIPGYQSLQNLRKDYRDCVQAEKDCFLIEIDYQSFEFDLLNSYLNIYTDDIDPHVKIIQDCFLFDKPEDYRALGKKINYAVIYGVNLNTLINEIEIEYNLKNIDLIHKKLEIHPFFIKIEEFKKLLYKERYIRRKMLVLTEFDRFIKIEKEHALLNNFISSSASDIFFKKMREILELLQSSKIDQSKNKVLLQNHDSILFQLEEDVINDTNLLDNIIVIVQSKINNFKPRYTLKYGKNWKNLI